MIQIHFSSNVKASAQSVLVLKENLKEGETASGTERILNFLVPVFSSCHANREKKYICVMHTFVSCY